MVLMHLQDFRLKVKPKKCHWFAVELRYLGMKFQPSIFHLNQRKYKPLLSGNAHQKMANFKVSWGLPVAIVASSLGMLKLLPHSMLCWVALQRQEMGGRKLLPRRNPTFGLRHVRHAFNQLRQLLTSALLLTT